LEANRHILPGAVYFSTKASTHSHARRVRLTALVERPIVVAHARIVSARLGVAHEEKRLHRSICCRSFRTRVITFQDGKVLMVEEFRPGIVRVAVTRFGRV
jgi:hypothetical protein